MLLEIAIADAYGAAFEYAPPRPGRPNDLARYHSHPKWKTTPGTYTDDTEMSLAIAELLVEKSRWTRENVAGKFVEVFKRGGERKGYATRFYDFLVSVADGQEFLERIRPDSEKSGAAMRSCPLGVVPDVDEMLRLCEIQARVTHDTPAGVASANAVAFMTHYFLYGLGPKSELAARVEELVPGAPHGHLWTTPFFGEVGATGCEAVHAAIQAIQASSSLSELLRKCVDLGGDVDTVAAIAVGAAAHAREIASDLPPVLVSGLENGAYGRDYIVKLDARLLALEGVRTPR